MRDCSSSRTDRAIKPHQTHSDQTLSDIEIPIIRLPPVNPPHSARLLCPTTPPMTSCTLKHAIPDLESGPPTKMPKILDKRGTTSFDIEDLRAKMCIPDRYNHMTVSTTWKPPSSESWQLVSNDDDPLEKFRATFQTVLPSSQTSKPQTTFTFDQEPGDSPYTIRKFFPELMKQVWKQCWEEDNSVLIIGQPGLGKTVSMYFLMACVLAVYPELPFLFFQGGRTYLFHQSNVYKGDLVSPVLPNCTNGRKRKLLCFVDVDNKKNKLVEFPYPLTRGLLNKSVTFIQASSPRKNNYRAW